MAVLDSHLIFSLSDVPVHMVGMEYSVIGFSDEGSCTHFSGINKAETGYLERSAVSSYWLSR